MQALASAALVGLLANKMGLLKVRLDDDKDLHGELAKLRVQRVRIVRRSQGTLLRIVYNYYALSYLIPQGKEGGPRQTEVAGSRRDWHIILNPPSPPPPSRLVIAPSRRGSRKLGNDFRRC